MAIDPSHFNDRMQGTLSTLLGLRIVEAKVTGEASAEVEFIARSRVSNAAAVRQHERSRFVREAGAWLYLDGDVTH